MPASDSLNASQNVIVSAYTASALFSVTVFCDFSAPLSGGTPMLSPLSSLAKFCAFPPRLPHRNFAFFLRFIAAFSHFSRCTSYKHHTTVFRLRSFAHSHLSEHCTAFLRLILPHRPAIPCRAHFFHFPHLACTFVLVTSPTTTKIAPRSTRAPCNIRHFLHCFQNVSRETSPSQRRGPLFCRRNVSRETLRSELSAYHKFFSDSA